jgi:hypothetical protein
MAIPDVELAFFEPIDEPDESGWVLRVSLGGSDFESRASPLVAQVGDVPVEALAIIGGGAVGFLKPCHRPERRYVSATSTSVCTTPTSPSPPSRTSEEGAGCGT